MTGLPRPGPSTNAAIVAIDSAAMMVWLTPTMIVRLASGSWTLRNICPRLVPSDSIASTVSDETVRMPCALMRMTGGSA